jgi:hypothetical protein
VKGTIRSLKNLSNQAFSSNYFTPNNRKGNIRIAPINLKTISSENPMIRKGRRINQINGSRKINTSASGQHSTKRINQRKIAINVLINYDNCFVVKAKYNPLS